MLGSFVLVAVFCTYTHTFCLLVFTFLQCSPFYSKIEIAQLAMLLCNLCDVQKLIKQDFYNNRIKLDTAAVFKLGLFQDDKHTV